MKNITRKLAIGAVCASLIGAASLASAAQFRGPHYHGSYVGRSYHSGPSFGVGVELGVGPAYYAPPVVVDPYYSDPYYYGPSAVVTGGIGIGIYGGGGYYHGGGRSYSGGGHSFGGGRGGGGHRH